MELRADAVVFVFDLDGSGRFRGLPRIRLGRKARHGLFHAGHGTGEHEAERMKEAHLRLRERMRGCHGDHLGQAAVQHEGAAQRGQFHLMELGDGLLDKSLLHAGAQVAEHELDEVFDLKGRGAGQ